MKEAIQESEAFLKDQPGYGKIDESMKAVFGSKKQFRSSALSSTESNRLGKIASDLAAYLTDIKPFWEYRTHNKKYERQAGIYGKLSESWYTRRFVDLTLNEVIKYWEVAGTGYPHITWDTQTSDIAVSAEDPRDVLPVRPADNISIQSCMAVIIRRERSVNYLRERYPEDKWGLIASDRDGGMRADQGETKFNQILDTLGVPSDSPFLRRLFGRPQRGTAKIPMADLHTCYMKDGRRNETSHPVLMGSFDKEGRAQNNWSYVVPPKGKLYPRGRLVVATSRGILHDGPNPYWHGLFPVPKLTLDPWPWAWLGKAPLHDVLPLQKSLS